MAHGPDQPLPVLNPVTEYEKIRRVGEGTYGVVCTFTMIASWPALASVHTITYTGAADKARNRKTGEIVALKKLRMDRECHGESFKVSKNFQQLSTCCENFPQISTCCQGCLSLLAFCVQACQSPLSGNSEFCSNVNIQTWSSSSRW